MSFAATLKAARERAGLTQQQLAEKLGVYREAVARFESGKHDPGWSTVQKLADVLGVELAAFRDDPAKPPAKKGKKKSG